MNEHEKFIKDLGFDEFSNLGDYLEFLRNGQEDVCINLLGNLLDASKEKGKLEQKKEEFGDFIKWLDWLINSPKNTWSKQIKTKLEQLQKEIEDNSHPEEDKVGIANRKDNLAYKKSSGSDKKEIGGEKQDE